MRKIMIVDDDREFASELAELLRDAGYAVETFADGVTALNAVQRVNPAVILLDFKMDKLAGYQVAWYLRNFQETATIPIIGMSAYASDDDPARRAAACGMSAFLKKPFNPLDIIARIEKLTGVTPAATGPAKVTVLRAGQAAMPHKRSISATMAGRRRAGVAAPLLEVQL